MSADESAVMVSSGRDPKFRADCIEWFHDPAHDNQKIQFRGPNHVYAALEQAAEQADRTFNDQMLHILGACRGARSLDFTDARSLSEWRDLIGQMTMQFHVGEEWIPCRAIFPTPEE